MKKTIQLTILFTLLIILAGCNKNDDDSSNNASNNIQGTWILVELNSSVALDLDEDGTFSTRLHEEKPCVLNTQITFSEGGALLNEASFAIFAFGDISIVCIDTSIEGTWSIENNNLTLEQAGTESSYEILLENNRLTVYDATQGFGNSEITAIYQK